MHNFGQQTLEGEFGPGALAVLAAASEGGRDDFDEDKHMGMAVFPIIPDTS